MQEQINLKISLNNNSRNITKYGIPTIYEEKVKVKDFQLFN